MQVPCFRLTLWWWGYSELPFCPSPDVRLCHQGAQGRLAVWRRKKGLAHPLSFQSLWVSSQQCFSPAPARDCSLPFLLIQHWQNLTVWDTSTGRWCTPPKCGGAAPFQPQGCPPILSAWLCPSHPLVPPVAGHCFLGCYLCDTLMFTFCISS